MQRKKKNNKFGETKEHHEWKVLKKRATDKRFEEIEEFGNEELFEVSSSRKDELHEMEWTKKSK